jgi:hypothetical protein
LMAGCRSGSPAGQAARPCPRQCARRPARAARVVRAGLTRSAGESSSTIKGGRRSLRRRRGGADAKDERRSRRRLLPARAGIAEQTAATIETRRATAKADCLPHASQAPSRGGECRGTNSPTRRVKAGIARPLRSSHRAKVPPEVLQTLSAAEKRGEIGRVDQNDISGSLLIRRHPKEAVELRVACRSEWMRMIEVDRLTRQHLNRLGVRRRQFVVRQMRMEIERRDVLQQPQTVEISEGRERRVVPSTSAGRRP